MHDGNFHQVIDLVPYVPEFLKVNVLVLDLVGVEYAVGRLRNDIFAEFGGTVPEPENLMAFGDKPLPEGFVDASSLPRPNQPFFDELLFHRTLSDVAP